MQQKQITPTQALDVLFQTMVTRAGLGVTDLQLVTESWRVIASLVADTQDAKTSAN